MKPTRIAILFAALITSLQLTAQEIAPIVPEAEVLKREFGVHDRNAFLEPAKVFYPETWFHFIGGNVSYEGITADLEAIAAAGLSGIHFFHGQYGGKWPATGEDIACMSEKWEEAVKFTASEARRLGLRFTMQNCPGWAMSGGPWIKPENAMRLIVSSRTTINGDKRIETTLPKPGPNKEEWRDYRDITVIAFPTPVGAKNPIPRPATVAGSGDFNWTGLLREGKSITLPAGGNTHKLEIAYDKPTTIRTLELSPIQRFNHSMCYNPKVTVKMYAIDSNGNETKVMDAPMPAANWQDGSRMCIACKEVEEAIRYRVEITNQYRMNIYHLQLLSIAYKNNWEAEAGWTLRGFERTSDDIVQSPEAYLQKENIVDVTEHMDENGTFSWEAPCKGDWTILRIGHINAGRKNGPAPPTGTGWECDKLSTEGPEVHFDGYIGHLADGALSGGMLNGLLLDSWECNTQTWTNKMEQEFEQHTGYELRSWLPTLFGFVIENPETTSRFLRDWRSTINELYSGKFYRRMSELGREKGLSVMYETAAGDVFPADILEYFKYADVPMCEFWHPFSEGYVGDLDFKPIKPTASAAHLYGKPRVNAESFTSFNLTWDEHFDMLKEVADFNAVEGVTHNVLHTYTHNPQINFLQPGTSFGSKIGTPFLRGQTWWKHMHEFTTYMARCSYMLERGKSVSDVLWYLGDEIGHKPSQKYPFPSGYKFDYCNPDILLNRLSVENGRIVTPEGLSYSLIWIPENKRMLPSTLKQLHKLMKEGALVVASAPKGICTLTGGKSAQRSFNKSVEKIWSNSEAGKFKSIGKGGILPGTDLDKALEILNIPADVKGKGIRWIHRRAEGADWYFVTPEQGKAFDGRVQFRATGKAEIWNAVTGEARLVPYSTENGYTTIEMSLPKGGSAFVVLHHDESTAKKADEKPKRQKSIEREWTLRFPAGWGAPEAITTSELKAWKELEMTNEGKAFSGTVSYSTTFEADEAMLATPLTLDLGKVDMIAKVKVNGKEVGTLWCAPYSLDISWAAVAGTNKLEIEVTSTWFNRLVYDASQPEEKRKTWTIAGPSANAKLRDSGLMGPVKLLY